MLRRSLFAWACAALLPLELVSAPLAAQPSARRMASPAVPSAGGGIAVAAPSAPVPVPEEACAREEAEGRFRRGRRLFLEGAWGAALAELLESRRLYPTWSATSSAGACLMTLGRFDEALEVLEGSLATYGDALPAAVKTTAQKQVIALRDRVGTIALVAAEPGAAVVIDGRARGEHPSTAPLRVVAGTHVVRIYKEGFEPFETAASVAGGQTTSVVARLAPPVASGRLRVAERSGRAARRDGGWFRGGQGAVGRADRGRRAHGGPARAVACRSGSVWPTPSPIG
ncbi:PEGA domain-containing protein [Sorangium sp. So ce542]|uniref:PEGA domain-containing protein n=1 Tax=Sorangium sp. So ce542 TaxID=3133316 RepID=UPI003F607770